MNSFKLIALFLLAPAYLHAESQPPAFDIGGMMKEMQKAANSLEQPATTTNPPAAQPSKPTAEQPQQPIHEPSQVVQPSGSDTKDVSASASEQPTTIIPPPGVALADMKFDSDPSAASSIPTTGISSSDMKVSDTHPSTGSSIPTTGVALADMKFDTDPSRGSSYVNEKWVIFVGILFTLFVASIPFVGLGKVLGAPILLVLGLWALKEKVASGKQSDDVEVLYRKGVSLSEKGDHGKAYDCFRKAALKEHAPSQYYLGESLCREDIDSRDKPDSYKSGLDWLTKAAYQGHSEAQNLLGQHYAYAAIRATNTDKEGDQERARTWFKLAAQQGNTDAQEWLVRIDED